MSSSFSEIRLVDVRKAFGRQPVLCGVSCLLERGEITLIMGPNGAGKSTLLTILSTLSRPTSGQATYGSHEHRLAERYLRHRIGLLGHSSMLYHQLSSRENLLFFARMYRVANPEKVVDHWLERIGMSRAAVKPVKQLSRGMVQRVTLARALLHDPDLLLLDEPFTGLDREALQLLRCELETARDRGKIVVLITHDVEAVDKLCGHLLIMDGGRAVGDLKEPDLSAARILEHYHAALTS